MKGWNWLFLSLIGVGLLLLGGGDRGCSLPSLNQHATAATYVYEKVDTAVPSEVRVAIDKLNQRNIIANVIDQNVLNGMEHVPAQYRLAIPAAQQAGLPSLVATAGEKVLKVTKDPHTEKQVMEGVP